MVHFWLHHTVHCAEKTVSARLYAGSASAESVREGEVGGVNRRVTCTWWLLGLAVKRPWLVRSGPPLSLAAWTGLRKHTTKLKYLWYYGKSINHFSLQKAVQDIYCSESPTAQEVFQLLNALMGDY